MRLGVGLALLGTGCFVTDAELTAALDRDGDGYLPVQTGGDDCDEGRADIHPGADEVCGDGLDNNCDGVPDDDGIGSRTWFLDEDGDGFGIESTVTACVEPEGYAPVAGDCDDGDPSLNPAAEDLCDGIDQDCDGIVDDAVPLVERYRDADGDGIGTTDETVLACTDVPGFVEVSGDCDDTDATVSPVAVDLCDGIDQDCDGVVDDDAVFTLRFFDGDGDGIGTDLDTIEDCGAVPGYVALGGDCDDTDPTVSPVAVDLCDGIDQDCDGVADDDAVFTAYFLDADGDGVGTSDIGVEACGPAPGFVLASGDCDDGDASISPLVLDGCDGIDNDCDGVVDNDVVRTLYFEDLDGDGVGSSVFEESCAPPPGFVQLTGDCDDTDASVRPDSLDPCDGVDQDCDGALDEDALFFLWFADTDGDGLGSLMDSLSTCDGAPAGYVATPGDCDDSDPAVAVPTWYEDSDGDGFGTDVMVLGCVMPPGFAAGPGDCDDARPGVHPDRPEICNNGRDDDCDPSTDCRWPATLLAEDADLVVPLPGSPNMIWVADLTGDAAGELVVEYSDHTEIRAPDSPTPLATMPFSGRVLLGLGEAPSLVDVTGDGRGDFLFQNAESSTLEVYTGGGAGVLTPTMVLALPGNVQAAVLDADGPDGAPGVWVSSAEGNGTIRFFPHTGGTVTISDATVEISGVPGEGLGGGNLAILPSFEGAHALVTSDAGGSAHIVRIFSDLGPGSFTSGDASWTYTSDVVFAVAFVNPWNTLVEAGLTILEGEWSSSSLSAIEIKLTGYSGPIEPSLDLSAPEVRVRVQFFERTGPFPVGDIDGDGFTDVLVLPYAVEGRLGILYGFDGLDRQPPGVDVFLPPEVGTTNIWAGTGDLDADGRVDLVVLGSEGGVGSARVYYGSGQ